LIERPDEAARGAEHTAGYLDNRHVEIVCAASARVNVSVLYQFVDTAKRPWPTSVARAAGFFPVGQRLARSSQKDGLPSCRGGDIRIRGSRPSTRARGAAWSLPLSNPEREWTPRRATLLCSPPCHSSAQASPGFGVTLFWVQSFLRSVESPLSA
jgi:hypothetical protein